jgi:hypothetical protein
MLSSQELAIGVKRSIRPNLGLPSKPILGRNVADGFFAGARLAEASLCWLRMTNKDKGFFNSV